MLYIHIYIYREREREREGAGYPSKEKKALRVYIIETSLPQILVSIIMLKGFGSQTRRDNFKRVCCCV